MNEQLHCGILGASTFRKEKQVTQEQVPHIGNSYTIKTIGARTSLKEKTATP